jgi:tRNA (guanine37-N1)-methyltransferase
MVFKPEPLVKAIEAIPREKKSIRVLLTPRGRLLNQEIISQLSTLDQLILICSRYEGVDERVSQLATDMEISVGDYVLSGGEAAALVLMDSLIRLLPGVVGNETSILQESFSQGLLEYPQYTRPPEFRGLKVPEVQLLGDHKAIEAWRQEMSIKLTQERRPDLLKKK